MFDDRLISDPEQEALARCIRAIGTPIFYRDLLRLAETVCGFEHLSVFAFSSTLVPQIEVLEGLDDPSITDHSARSYLGFGYHSSDPARAKMRELQFAADTPAVFVLRASDIVDVAYRRDIYEKFGLDGRVSLIGQADGGWRSVNFYKHKDRGGLSDADISALTRRARVLFAAEIKHIELQRDGKASTALTPVIPSLDFLQELLATFAPALSKREAEVCARALQGMTGEGTALSMSITEATVATLRRRAYAKLGISNLNELFALCLSSVARRKVD